MASHKRYRLNQLFDEAISSRAKLQQIRIDISAKLLDDTRKSELQSALTAADQESKRVMTMLSEQLQRDESESDD